MNASSRRTFLLRVALALALGSGPGLGQAQITNVPSPRIELTELQVSRGEEGGLILSYDIDLELSRDVEDALSKGVAVVFVARAEVFRSRWYWSDKLRTVAERRWRLAYQPLTRRWRVTFEGLSQYYGSLPEALGVMRRNSRWRIMDSAPSPDDRAHYLEFSFQLDRDELPRPMQIGLSDQSGWTLAVGHRMPIVLNR